jgi:F0F1-type ATP synthase assembly protein I
MSSHAPDDSSKAESDRVAGREGQADAYGALGLVISGVLVWGGVGFLVAERLDNRLFVMLGLLLGMGAGLYLVWYRYGRQT